MNSSIIDFIKTASKEDIRTMYDLLKVRQETIRNEIKYEFQRGDRVQFTSRDDVIHGIIIKKNPKVAQVRADNGMQWNVSYSLLKASDAPVVVGRISDKDLSKIIDSDLAQ